MTGRYGSMYGPDVTYFGVPHCDLGDPDSYADADVVILGTSASAAPPSSPASPPDRVVLEALSAVARRRRDAVDGTTWDPARPLLDR